MNLAVFMLWIKYLGQSYGIQSQHQLAQIKHNRNNKISVSYYLMNVWVINKDIYKHVHI